jgi:integrase
MLDTKREYLTLDELIKLKATPCEDDEIRGAAIFSIYTGLRFSDIKSMTWGNIKEGNNGMYLEYRQRKTKALEHIPISTDVIELLGEPKSSNELIFPELSKKKRYNRVIKKWISDAGINKIITFHCFRHTNATLLIAKGVDLYTVSKILGHKSIKTTQIYAKVIDENKRNAINLIKF